MAAGFMRHLSNGGVEVFSGGSEPGDSLNEIVVAAMAEKGIDISTEIPRLWAHEIVRAADEVVTMGCGDACPVFPGKRYLDRELGRPRPVSPSKRSGRSETRSSRVSASCSESSSRVRSADRHHRLTAQIRPNELGAIRGDCGPGPLAALFSGDHPGLNQDRPVMAHCGLAPLQWIVQVTYAHFPFRHGSDEAEQTETHWISQPFECTSKVLCFEYGEGLVGDRLTAAGRIHGPSL
jgi:protein-tyrosine-phosphatase